MPHKISRGWPGAFNSLFLVLFLVSSTWANPPVQETPPTIPSLAEEPPIPSAPNSTGIEQPSETNPLSSSEPSDSLIGPTMTPSDSMVLNEPEQPEELAPTEPLNYVKLTGRIWRVKSGFVFARTPVGTLTLFSKKGLKSVKGAQKVTVWTHDSNVVVDFHKKNDSTPLRRFITGTPTAASSTDSSLQLWTPEGTFSLPTAPSTGILKGIKEGVPLTIQLNKAQEIVGTPEINVDIQISKATSPRPDAKLKLDGTVLRVKAGFAFVETPIGILLLSKNTGFRNPKKGQSISVWMNEDYLVIDVRQKDGTDLAHRFITSKVVYATDTKQEIKLWTPEGEKTMTLPPNKKRKRSFKSGTPITVHVNKEGHIVDVRKAS